MEQDYYNLNFGLYDKMKVEALRQIKVNSGK